MKSFLENILQRPKGQRIAILASVLILLMSGYYLYFYGPLASEISRLVDDVEAVRSDKAIKQQKAANLPKLQKELAELNARLKEAVAQLPNKKEIAGLLTAISTKAQESGLQVVLFRPRNENFREFYAEVPVDITVKGNFHNIVTFFDEVGRLHRLINIDNIGFKNPQINGDQVILETTSLATAFRFLDEAERNRIAEEKAKAAKEKK